MRRRNSIITLLLTLSMVFSTSAFAVFADTTDQEEQIDNAAPTTEEVVEETPEVPAATTEQAGDVQEPVAEPTEPEGTVTPAEEPTAETKGAAAIGIGDEYVENETDNKQGRNWTYVGSTRTLTLTNYSSDQSIVVYDSDINLNIVLQGNNTVNGGIWSNENSGKWTISGSGSLTIDGSKIGNNHGIVNGSGTVRIEGGSISIKNVGPGIIATDVVISGGNIKVSAYGSPLISRKKISFSGDIYADIELVDQPGPGPQKVIDIPAVFSGEKDGITLSDDVQIVLPQNGKKATFKPEEIDEGMTIADASGKPAKHVILKGARNPSGILIATSVANGKTDMAISWTAMNDVDGYDVFFARCNTKSKKYEPELVASVKADTTAYTVSGLKKGTPYKAYVQAYVLKSGAKQYVGTSLLTHAFAGGSSKRFTNPKSVKVKKSNVSVKTGKKYKIRASVRKVKKSKKLIRVGHAPKLRYLSSNTSIATVSKKGKIKGVAPGTCTVYAIAANGVYKAVNVTVK